LPWYKKYGITNVIERISTHIINNLTGSLRRTPYPLRIKAINMKNMKNTKKANVLAGLDKFRLYAVPRGIYIKEGTYGVYKVRHNGGKPTEREAVRAAMNDAEGNLVKGWIINMAGRQRTFKADGSGYEVFPLKE
jgi:hypothetical protein